jgi:hypothetical protein
VKRIDVSNYRGFTILSTVGNFFFALLVYRYILEDLKGQLADCQHGFLKGRSTVTNFVLKSIDAFDKVRHHLLLDKMLTVVEPSRCQWSGAYFSGRI